MLKGKWDRKMGQTTDSICGNSRKFLLSGATIAAVIALTAPAIPAKVYAAGNHYEWVKQTDHDLLGGSYTAVASSADGSHLIIGSTNGGENLSQPSPLYISDDYGTTWENVTEDAQNGVRNYWKSVDISNNGQTMVAASDETRDLDTLDFDDGNIFISQNGGASWSDVTPVGVDNWQSVVVSGDGNTIAAITSDDDDNVYISNNHGASWHTSEVDDLWGWETLSIANSGDKILVGGENGWDGESHLYLTSDGGDTWDDVTPSVPSMPWLNGEKADISGDGTKIAVALYGWDGDAHHAVYRSVNGGDTWSDVSPADTGGNEFNTLTMSNDGTKIAVLDPDSGMYITTDAGAEWSQEDPGEAYDDSNSWVAADMDASGERMVAAGQNNAYVTTHTDSSNEDEEGVLTTFSNAENAKTITLTTPAGTTITCHSAVKESALSAQDGAYSYPLGLVDFCFSGADASNEISLIFVTDLKPNEVAVRKFNPTTKQYATISAANVTETTFNGQHALHVSYTITDNGPLDTDPDTGEVSDPVGLAVLSATAPNTGLAHQDTLPFVLAGAAGITMLATLVVSQRRKAHEIARSSK
jgi:photosystem II stability/assembly factor-like uncharacterized protein